MNADGRPEAGKDSAEMNVDPRLAPPAPAAPSATAAAPGADAAPETGPLLLGRPDTALLPPGPDRKPERAPDTAAAPASEAGRPPLPTAPVHLPVKWEGRLGKLILVARSRGGMGATSVAVNLALELVRRHGLFRAHGGRRVALVDLDVQFGTAGSILDIEDRGGLLELARMAGEPDLQAVRTVLLTHASGLHVLPAPKRPVPLDLLDETRVASIIEPLLAEHDFVIVDLPHALVRWLEPLLIRADRLLMVTDLAVPSVVTARRVIDLMRGDNPELAVEIVVTRDRKPLYPGKLQRDAVAALGLPLSHWIPEEVRLSRKAFDRGEPLVELAPRCPWSRALRKLAHHIETTAAAAQQTQKG
jgi:pilus assembly protein CpaE